MRKRVGALVAVMALVVFTGLASYAAAWYTTQVKYASFVSGPAGACGYNIGGSTQYGYSFTGTDTYPQFYSGVETHNNVNCAYAYSLTVRVTGTDPNGALLAGNRFGSLSALISPNPSGQTNQVMTTVYQFLLNVLPYGIGSDIQYLTGSPQSPNFDATSAWATWTACIWCTPADAGLQFGYRLVVDPTLSGTYRLQIDYHFENVVFHQRFQSTNRYDLYDNLVYCFNYCTTSDDFETVGLWPGNTAGGTSFLAGAMWGYSTAASKSPTHSVTVGFNGGGTDGTDYGSVWDFRDFATTRVNHIMISYDDHLWSHNGNYWDRLSAGVRMRLYNSAGTNYATYEYWLASWYQATNCQTPGTNQISISCKPPTDTWQYLSRYPNSDWTINWSGCTRVRIEVFASAVGTNADQFQMFFDDFAMT